KHQKQLRIRVHGFLMLAQQHLADPFGYRGSPGSRVISGGQPPSASAWAKMPRLVDLPAPSGPSKVMNNPLMVFLHWHCFPPVADWSDSWSPDSGSGSDARRGYAAAASPKTRVNRRPGQRNTGCGPAWD